MIPETFLKKTAVSFLIGLCLLNIQIYSEANIDKPLVQMQEAEFDMEVIKLQIECIIKIYTKIDFTLELLTQIVNNNQVRSIEKKETIEKLTDFRSMVRFISNESNLTMEPHTVVILDAILKPILQYVQNLIASGLTQFPPFDLENIVKRAAKDSFDAKKIANNVKKSQEMLIKINKEAEQVGLSFFNRAYRKLESVNEKYHFGSLALKFGALSTVGLFVTGMALFYTKNENRPEFLNTWIGETPVWGENGKLVNSNQGENLKTWARAYATLRGLNIVNPQMAPVITPAIITGLFQADWHKLKRWFAQKSESVRSYLRGGPVNKKIDRWRKEPQYTFADVIGEWHKKKIFWPVVEYMTNPEQFIRSGLRPPYAFILAGKTRAGKSFFTECLAGQIIANRKAAGINDPFNFLVFNPGEIIKEGISLTELLAYAKHYAPCVLVIDEADMLRLQREQDAKALSELLTAMSGVMNPDSDKPVIIIAATNKPENFDNSLRQPGRFETILWFDYPSQEERLEFLVTEIQKRGILSIEKEYIERFARETEECSFEELKLILKTALIKARSLGRPVTQADIEQAFDEITRKIIFDDLNLNAQEKKLFASHQAGHALATILLDQKHELTKVTIQFVNKAIVEKSVWAKYYNQNQDDIKQTDEQHGEYGKVFKAKNPDAAGFDNNHDLFAECKIHLAGHVAEEILNGSTGYTYHREDRFKALAIAKYIVFKGMKESELSKGTLAKLTLEAEQLIEKAEKEVRTLLISNKKLLEAITKTLQERSTITGNDIKQLQKEYGAK